MSYIIAVCHLSRGAEIQKLDEFMRAEKLPIVNTLQYI